MTKDTQYTARGSVWPAFIALSLLYVGVGCWWGGKTYTVFDKNDQLAQADYAKCVGYGLKSCDERGNSTAAGLAFLDGLIWPISIPVALGEQS